MKGISSGLAVALATAILGASAWAGTLETVTVTGSRVVTEKESKTRSIVGAPIREITLSYAVSIADLDLKTVPGQLELQKRVTAAAEGACREIENLALGNITSPDHATCVKKAFDDAMEKARNK